MYYSINGLYYYYYEKGWEYDRDMNDGFYYDNYFDIYCFDNKCYYYDSKKDAFFADSKYFYTDNDVYGWEYGVFYEKESGGKIYMDENDEDFGYCFPNYSPITVIIC